MTTANAHLAHDRWSVASQATGLLNYLKMLAEAFSEGLQQAHEARRKHPFADV
ncbi:hypothetical protein [Pseudolabrys sp. FHR47]|uniref:hypothetical protein n=1 Tax=Pseudolabrys sp. FHR47 TaxID=2562284 RepID=UPI00143DB2E4|nr:hypothetical protein [Pseudolabrys sp. FHR47]